MLDQSEMETDKKEKEKEKHEVKDIVGLLNVNAQSKKAKPVLLPVKFIALSDILKLEIDSKAWCWAIFWGRRNSTKQEDSNLWSSMQFGYRDNICSFQRRMT